MNTFEYNRRKSGMSQAVLAKKLSISQGTISAWESGRTRPRSDTLIRLAEVLECTVDELLRG